DLRAFLPELPEFTANVREIIRRARDLHVRVVFATQPMLFDETDRWRHVEGSFYWIHDTTGVLSAASYWRLLDVYNRALVTTCEAESVACCDLASEIPHDARYFYDGVHVTDAGAALVAKRLA